MSEYTREDIIIFSDDERLKDAIGKECYFSDSPNTIILDINNNKIKPYKLDCIESDTFMPFLSRDQRASYKWHCLVIKKEEYVPFESAEEFFNASLEHNKNHYLFGIGIWIKCKESFDANTEPFLAAVSELHDKCVYIGGYDDYISFDKLLKCCEFLDGTPCGSYHK